LKPRQLTWIALFVVLDIVCARLSLTLWAIPLTMQSVSVRLAGYMLPVKEAFLAQAVYVALGLVGLPVFAGGGGLHYLLAPSFGYLVGFLVTAPLVSYLSRVWNPQDHFGRMLLVGLVSMPALFIPGVLYMKLVLNPTWAQAWTAGMLAFLVPDLIKIVLSATLACRLKRAGWRPRREASRPAL